MAFIRLKRNWFGPNGVRYRARDGLIQVPDAYVDLAPSDAEVFDDNNQPLPSKSKQKMPGHGAKPLHELNMDLIPGMAPTHMIATVATEAPRPPLSDEERKKHNEAAEKAVDDLRLDSRKASSEAQKEEGEAIQKGIDLVQELQEKQAEANDPIEAAANRDAGGTRPTSAPTAAAKSGDKK